MSFGHEDPRVFKRRGTTPVEKTFDDEVATSISQTVKGHEASGSNVTLVRNSLT